MSNHSYTIRNYRPADLDEYVQLITEAEKLEPTGRCISPELISESLGRPNYSPEQDLFIVEIGGKIVGYLDITPEVLIGRIILNCFIYPDHRRQGLATKLFSYVKYRARELGVKLAHVNIDQDNATARNVLSRLGFSPVHRFLQLRLDMARVRQRDINKAALPCRYLQRGEEDKLTQIQNSSFADTWGYNPNTTEEIMYYTSSAGFRPEDVILACDGDKIAGYRWTRIIHETTPEERKGQIFMLGVDPACRGKGIGKVVLLAGLSHLENKGVRVVELTVDSENKAACTLYQSIGFEVQASSLWYEKETG